MNEIPKVGDVIPDQWGKLICVSVDEAKQTCVVKRVGTVSRNPYVMSIFEWRKRISENNSKDSNSPSS